MYLLSFRMEHISFQSPTTLWTRASLFHIKFYRVPVDNIMVSNSSMHSILLEPLFLLFKNNSFYIQFLSLIINLNYTTLVLFYLNLSSFKIYNHVIYRLGVTYRLSATLSIEAKVTLFM